MDDIIRWFTRFIEEGVLNDVAINFAQEAFKEYIKPKLADIWDWCTENWEDIWGTIISFFG